MEIISTQHNDQGDGLFKKSHQSQSDIREINDFKRFYESKDDYKRVEIKQIRDRSYNSALSKGANDLTVKSDRAVMSSRVNQKSVTEQVIGKNGSFRSVSSNANALNVYRSNTVSESEQSRKVVVYRSHQNETKKPVKDVNMTLTGDRSVILIVRAYKKNAQEVIGWIKSNFQHGIDSLIVNGKKILNRKVS